MLTRTNICITDFAAVETMIQDLSLFILGEYELSCKDHNMIESFKPDLRWYGLTNYWYGLTNYQCVYGRWLW